MVTEDNGPPVPELARRMTQTSCRLDPARAMVPVLKRLAASGVPLGDVLDDSGYAHRVPGNWAVPLRAAGAQLIQDLHPDDRGPHGTHAGAVISNGSLHCPATPRPLPGPGPLARDATPEDTAAHDQQTAETARYKLGKITAGDAGGYHRVMCPAVTGETPLPAAAQVDGPGLPAAPDPRPARAPPRVLHSADRHRASRGARQDRAKTRLPLPGAPALLRAPLCRRADLLHRQGPCQQRHQPRLVPPDGPGPDRAVRRLPAHRPQPAHPRGLQRPPGTEHPARRRRAPAENPPPAPQATGQPRRRPAITGQ